MGMSYFHARAEERQLVSICQGVLKTQVRLYPGSKMAQQDGTISVNLTASPHANHTILLNLGLRDLSHM